MKQLFATSLALLILVVSAKDLVIWAGFKINQGFIAKTLCINKDKPALKCQGKCFLTKKITESKDDDQRTAPVLSPDELKQTVFYQTINQAEPNGLAAYANQFFLSITTLCGQSCLADIFQPPKIWHTSRLT